MGRRVRTLWGWWGQLDALWGFVEAVRWALSVMGVAALLLTLRGRFVGVLGDYWFVAFTLIALALAVAPWLIHWRGSAPAQRIMHSGKGVPIRATPSQATSRKPTGSGNTVSEIVAYLDIESTDEGNPLRNCRVKLLELEHYFAWTQDGEVKERWDRDSFYAGQTYFFCWSGRASSIDAVDIYTKERATIARCINVRPELATTAGAVGHLFHGDQYHLTLEITADNSRPLRKELWLQMHQGKSPIIAEWDDTRTSWL